MVYYKYTIHSVYNTLRYYVRTYVRVCFTALGGFAHAAVQTASCSRETKNTESKKSSIAQSTS